MLVLYICLYGLTLLIPTLQLSGLFNFVAACIHVEHSISGYMDDTQILHLKSKYIKYSKYCQIRHLFQHPYSNPNHSIFDNKYDTRMIHLKSKYVKYSQYYQIRRQHSFKVKICKIFKILSNLTATPVSDNPYSNTGNIGLNTHHYVISKVLCSGRAVVSQ